MFLKKITILGSGTAGYIAALMLKSKFSYLNIEIISSSQIGIIGVGEGSTEHWKSFMQLTEITTEDLIKECDATFKLGIKFINWSESDYLHHVSSPICTQELGKYLYNQATSIIKNKDKMFFSDPFLFMGKICYEKNKNLSLNDFCHQFHFDTFKLNVFLKNKCLFNNIVCHEDTIKDGTLNDQGNVSYLIGEKQNYFSDFFIDASGFNKVIIKKMHGYTWQDYQKYFPLNRVLAFQDTPEQISKYLNFYTKSTALKYGWSWQIPTQTRTGNGYVFNKDYISDEKALNEIEVLYNKKITEVRYIDLNPGKCKKSWIKNVLAIGLSSNFVEPLEATSISTTIKQMWNFFDYLPSLDIDSFNIVSDELFENIVDFLQLHYKTNKKNSNFWKNIKENIVWRDGVNHRLKIAEKRLLNRDDFNNNKQGLFTSCNWNCVLDGLNLYNLDNLKKEYKNTIPDWLIPQAELIYKNKIDYLNKPFLSEKFIIDSIKNEQNTIHSFRA